MQSIKILIVEDEWIISEEIKELLLLKGFDVVGQVEDSVSALDVFQEHEVDVALLDINIKGPKDGIELAKEIIEEHNCAIIFLTAFDDEHFLNRAKEVRPAAYIVKPYQARNLEMAVEIAFNNLMESNNPPKQDSYILPDFVFIKEGSRFKKIALESIHYAEAVGSYTDIYSDEGKSTLAINLKTFESNINDSQFLRIHRSFLINLNHIEAFEGNRVFINKKPIPISSAHKAEFTKRFKIT